MAWSYHLLFVGVNNGIDTAHHLNHPQDEAKRLSLEFENLGMDRGQDNVLLTGEKATSDQIRRQLGTISVLDPCDLLLVYWSGHLYRTANSLYFVAAETKALHNIQEMVSLDDLLRIFNGATAAARVLILDTCYAADAIEELNRIRNAIEDAYNKRRSSVSNLAYVLAACQPGGQAIDGVLTNALLQELRDQILVEGKELDLVKTLNGTIRQVKKQGKQSPHFQVGGTDTAIRIPVKRSDAYISSLTETDSLEQALGYAIRAFREFLNKNVVQGVELIYFLSYDVWDGCLVYDGLVRGSIEQQLLDYIRNVFLNRDRLRSRYEEKQRDQRGLGAAGRCFDAARKAIQNGEEPLNELRYHGDLRNYSSEYVEFDRLLGLRSCLYIPVIAPTISTSDKKNNIDNFRVPLGGVLMAANRTAYGLEPVSAQADIDWNRAKGLQDSQDLARDSKQMGLKDLDTNISKCIRDKLLALNRPGERGIDPFLKCIGGVYEQKGHQRVGLRDTLHPRLAKALARMLKKEGEGEKKFPEVHNISQKLEQHVAAQGVRSEQKLLEFANFLRQNRYGKFYPDNLTDLPHADELTSQYVIPYVWRDLELNCRLLLGELERDANLSDQQRADLQERLTALENEINQDATPGKTWGRYVEEHSRRKERVSESYWRNGNVFKMTPEPMSKQLDPFYRDLVDDLLDNVREGILSPFNIYRRTLKPLGPIEKYVGGISQVEALLESPERQRCLNDLAHSLHIWLLGRWLLEAQNGQLRERTLDCMRRSAANSSIIPDRFKQELLSLWQQDDMKDKISVYWALIAVMHNVANPVERFGDWCRAFFKRYLGAGSLDYHSWQPLVMLNIFDHHRFPVYKNAITGLHPAETRDWLDIIFCNQFFTRRDHAITGALMLAYELERLTDTSESGLWSLIMPDFRRLSKTSPPLWLIAYLAHAVAFTHLPGLRKGSWSGEEQPKFAEYFDGVAKVFIIKLSEFPLTFLLSLCDLLMGSSVDPMKGYKIKESSAWNSMRPSPFYVSDVGVKNETTIISLRLWEDGIDAEDKKICTRNVMKNLIQNYDGYKQTFKNNEPKKQIWRLYELDEFEEKKKHFRENNEVWGRIEIPGIIDNKEEIVVSRQAYEVLVMIQKLSDFETCYIADKWNFEIQFQNIGDDKDLLKYKMGDPNPLG